MSEPNKQTLEELAKEIESNRRTFQRDAEKMIYDEIRKDLKLIFSYGGAGIQQPDNQQAGNESGNGDDENKTRVHLLTIPMAIITVLYCLLVAGVLCYLRGMDQHLCANVCVVLVIILVLATLVLVLAGRYCVVMMQLHNEKEKIDKKDEKKASKPEPTFKEKVLKRTQEAVLEKVVEDTIKAFYK